MQRPNALQAFPWPALLSCKRFASESCWADLRTSARCASTHCSSPFRAAHRGGHLAPAPVCAVKMALPASDCGPHGTYTRWRRARRSEERREGAGWPRRNKNTHTQPWARGQAFPRTGHTSVMMGGVRPTSRSRYTFVLRAQWESDWGHRSRGVAICSARPSHVYRM